MTESELKAYSFVESLPGGDLMGAGVFGLLPNEDQPNDARQSLDIRDWFADSGILICRPGSMGTCRLAVALKGGDNGASHNHNDVGSFVVVCGNEAPIVDPGAEVYTARTFGPNRYQSNLLSSLGQPSAFSAMVKGFDGECPCCRRNFVDGS